MRFVIVALGLATPVPVLGQVDSTYSAARSVLTRVTDTAAARAAGYEPFRFPRVKDHTPFQGQHWIRDDVLDARDVDLRRPPFIMFLPRNGQLVPVGVAYGLNVRGSEPLPGDLVGYDAKWHAHQWCEAVPGEGLALADGYEDCLDRGGRPHPEQTTMVHVWTVETPDGLYAHDNPLLPFMALGMSGRYESFHGSESHDARVLALALGETYGAQLHYARLIERIGASSTDRTELDGHRATLREIAKTLEMAEQDENQEKYEAAKLRALEVFELMTDVYRSAAPSSELRDQLNRQLEAAASSHSWH